MKRLLPIILALFLMTLGTSCGGESGDSVDRSVLSAESAAGTWNLTAVWADKYYSIDEYTKAYGASIEESIDISEDGSAVYQFHQKGEPVDASGTWTIEGEDLTLTLDDGTALTYTYIAEEGEDPFFAFEAKDVNGTVKYVVVFERG